MTFRKGHHPTHDMAAAGRKGKASSPWRHSRTTAPRDRKPGSGKPKGD